MINITVDKKIPGTKQFFLPRVMKVGHDVFPFNPPKIQSHAVNGRSATEELAHSSKFQ